ncbi:di-trans,poly-cis-decaprenylcistransferase [Candidatus Roizmanbacteria bacterium RIFCSPLOWO2_01_FULL_37_13]|uniref:Isoprenyl transferase n=1 Tax=Candidatus Roizmanbacteria bacterium RIFCSPHIGHO2_02_FULL_38_11 TaxID=1802039 RepID=A0A1F7GYQ5_9BACT|nr:MAG: di-trans,poly-cis-decaprenylcistransferase [Candidatus Roizmanbacteria bacterium RIFCSPHIGHO2_02_FULL_38_11]OGK33401.1 MAG: di-trans,poly-cis-decaprenylcistransferase [Candidatus Roizmanbacteria bacterium RIFCSPHIGHO2_12_FULL_37_9b]OGK42874.1 MAG: di-trans,poly-cis-decaprenylcistransferase [Candidatus Roizmanbacteria bacterium RIFCSPLOWO2_01_FULL_37_13]
MKHETLKRNIPKHVAIILDGNRRWARERRLPTLEGHRRGLNAVIEISKKARQMGIKILTVWVFSTENWDRSKAEVSYIMKLGERAVANYLKEALKEQVRIIHIGRKDRIPNNLRDKLREAEEKTKKFSKYFFVIALDFGGRDDIIRAIKKIRNPQSVIKNLDEISFSQFLDTKKLPQSDIDLVIRTGGEIRTSGFMIWQAAYAEYIFVKKYMPDFTPEDFEECIKEYSQRQRRFGR